MKVIEFPRTKGDRAKPRVVFSVYTDGTVEGRVTDAPFPKDRQELIEALKLAKEELKRRINRNEP